MHRGDSKLRCGVGGEEEALKLDTGGGERMWLADACPRGFRLIYQNFIQLILLRKYLVDDEFQTRDLGVKNAEK